MKRIKITNLTVLADCFDPEHPEEDAVRLIEAMNVVLRENISSPPWLNGQCVAVKLHSPPLIGYEELLVEVYEGD